MTVGKGTRGSKACVLPFPCRNYIYVNRQWGPARAAQHTPEYAKRIVAQFNKKGEVDQRIAMGQGVERQTKAHIK